MDLWLRESFISYHTSSRIIREIFRQSALLQDLPLSPLPTKDNLPRSRTQFADSVRFLTRNDKELESPTSGPEQKDSKPIYRIRTRPTEHLLFDYGLFMAYEAAVKELMQVDRLRTVAIKKYKRAYRILQELLYPAVHPAARKPAPRGSKDTQDTASMELPSSPENSYNKTILQGFMRAIRERLDLLITAERNAQKRGKDSRPSPPRASPTAELQRNPER